MQGDAREASLKGLKGAIDGAAGIVYGKAAIDGIDRTSGEVSSADGTTVQTVYGYPTATSAGIGAAVNGLSSDDWISNIPTGTEAPAIQYSFSGNNEWDTNEDQGCNVTYTQATSSAVATSAIYTGGC